MKIILTGSTGSVGGAVLRNCIVNPSITSIIALTRRPLDIEDPKLTSIIHKDFRSYDAEVLSKLEGAEACVWALGSPKSGKEVHLDYTMAAIDIFLASLVPKVSSGKPFRFVYTSGALVPVLESKALFFLGPKRFLRAGIDRDVLAVESQNNGRWESIVVRPAIVADSEPLIKYIISNSFIFKEELGAAMVDAALGRSEKRILDNADLRAQGQRALKAFN